MIIQDLGGDNSTSGAQESSEIPCSLATDHRRDPCYQSAPLGGTARVLVLMPVSHDWQETNYKPRVTAPHPSTVEFPTVSLMHCDKINAAVSRIVNSTIW